jgi:dihydroorotase
MSMNPARGYRAIGKGNIAPGFDADLVLVDMHKKRRVERSHLQTKVGWSPFEGLELQGWPVVTIVRGQIAMRDGQIDAAVRGAEVRIAEPGVEYA